MILQKKRKIKVNQDSKSKYLKVHDLLMNFHLNYAFGSPNTFSSLISFDDRVQL